MTSLEQLELQQFLEQKGLVTWSSTEVSSDHIFARARILFPKALVLAMEMEKAPMETAPSGQAYQEIFRTYHSLGVLVNQIADWLRERGFGAHAGPAIGGDVDYIALAQKAGMGIRGRSGLLLGPLAGPLVRLAAIYTSVENLPPTKTLETSWVKEYCKTCGACVQACPAKAIQPDYLDYTKCAKPFSKNLGCSICIKVCPFSRLGWERVKTVYLKNKELPHDQ